MTNNLKSQDNVRIRVNIFKQIVLNNQSSFLPLIETINYTDTNTNNLIYILKDYPYLPIKMF